MTTKKTKLPPGWERCRTGSKGVRKWRNMETKCWVTDHADDPDTLHCGVCGVPSKRPRCLYTPEQAMQCIDSECADHAESLSSPNDKKTMTTPTTPLIALQPDTSYNNAGLIRMKAATTPIAPTATPRTDAEYEELDACADPTNKERFEVMADFSRTLERELQAALANLEEVTKDRNYIASHWALKCEGLEERENNLRAQLTAARRDTERLDWLEGKDSGNVGIDHGYWNQDMPEPGKLFVHLYDMGPDCDERGECLGEADNLRAAIDAAMRPEAGKQSTHNLNTNVINLH